MENTGTMTITIDKDGKITSDIKGVKGKSCTGIDAFLGTLGETLSDVKTKEYNEQKIQNQRIVHYS